MKRLWLLILLVLSAAAAASCGKTQSRDVAEGEYAVYCFQRGEKELIAMPYSAVAANSSAILRELAVQLDEGDPDKGYYSVLSDDFEIASVSLESGLVSVDFSKYNKSNALREILVRAAVVRTLSQVPDTYRFLLTLNGEPLFKTEYGPVEFHASDFYLNVTDTTEVSEIALQFATADRRELKTVFRKVLFNDYELRPRYVLEALLAGPAENETGFVKVTPDGVRILDVRVRDGICYVDFSKEFEKNPVPVSGASVIQAITTSIIVSSAGGTGPDIEGVVYSVEGVRLQTYREYELPAVCVASIAAAMN